jgi:hypothetical protein
MPGPHSPTPATTHIVGKDSWLFGNDSVRVALTHDGGHMAPVRFYLPNSVVAEPYYIGPWGADDVSVPLDEPCVKFLRGDFFCMPFGNPGTHGGDRNLLHGEPSFATWQLEGTGSAAGVNAYTFTLKTTHPPGTLTKRLFLVDGHTAIYLQHELAGYSGSFPAGHHATLAMPEQPESVLVGISPYRYGHTWPSPFGDPATHGSYYALAVNARFEDLAAVPLIFKDPPTGACNAFPTRRGYTDAAACITEHRSDPAWVTATFTTHGFVWFALKNAQDFPLTLLWMANHGRHASPWNGRENCLGVEDIRALFGEGWHASAEPNFLSNDGVPTAFTCTPQTPLKLNYIQGVAAAPPGFGRVANAVFEAGAVRFVDERGTEVRAAVDHAYLRGSNPPVLTRPG